MRRRPIVGALLLLGLMVASSTEVWACRYNVRETGFVDLGTETYHLVFYTDSGAAIDEISELKALTTELLAESPVSFQVVSIEDQPSHPTSKYRLPVYKGSRPSAALVSPAGRPLWLGALWEGRFSTEKVQTALSEVISSPLRKRIAEELATAFAVVLLIEGENDEENNRASDQVLQAIATLNSELEYFPKPIKQGPVKVSLNREDLISEKVLLWSLHLEPDDIVQPVAAVIYGKGRWIGPLMTGNEISREFLCNILFLVGADCECDLDPRLLRGTGLPIPWNKRLRSVVSRELGFDPENPLVRIEVSQIMRVHNWSTQAGEDQSGGVELPVTGDKTDKVRHGLFSFQPLYIIGGIAFLVLVLGILKLIRGSRHS